MIGGIFNSLFGNAAPNSTNNAASTALSGDASNLGSLNTQQINYEKGLEPQRENTINDEIQGLNPAGIQSNINQFGAGANEQAGDSARDLGLTNASSGIGANTTAGQAANLYQNANNQTNKYAAQVNSPQARAQMLQQQIGAINSGQTPTSLAQELQLYGPLQQTASFNNQLNQQGNQFANQILGTLGGVGANLLEGGLPGLMQGATQSPTIFGGNVGIGGYNSSVSVPNTSDPGGANYVGSGSFNPGNLGGVIGSSQSPNYNQSLAA